MSRESIKAFKYAFIQSVPVLFGYVFLGAAFGILLQKAGYNYIWAMFASLTVYAGSLQFVLVSFLSLGTALTTVALMSLFINSRHIFYGLSFIERFKETGKAYPYMVFSLTDETYSVLCSLKVPDGINKNTVMFLIALLNHVYWVAGSVLGALIGQMIPFDATGIDFSMTSLFVVIFLEQWKSSRNHTPALIGFASGIFFLVIFGPDNFLLPSLVATVVLLTVCRPFIKFREEK
ncbi:MAG TPA: branched-chain amino acid ABC transporter permease [Clostridiaceae bacterium]|nr:branched-chain amino acid ABC transporter permease [Clostridiaceae bacterium]